MLLFRISHWDSASPKLSTTGVSPGKGSSAGTPKAPWTPTVGVRDNGLGVVLGVGELGGGALRWPDTSEQLRGGIGTCGLGVVVVVVAALGGDGRVERDVVLLLGTCGLGANSGNSIDSLS